MAKKGLLRKSAVPVALALSGVLCLSTIAVANQKLSASADSSVSSTAIFKSDYKSREEVLKATLDLNDRLAEEGMVLVKNNNEALPLLNTKPRVSVFGYASVHPTVGASNNGGDTSAGEARVDADLYTSLADAGFVVNPAVKAFYTNTSAKDDSAIVGSKTWDNVLKDVESTYHSYSDAAIVMLASSAGTVEHARQFGEEQQALVEYLGQKFGKVILLVNNSYPFELGWAEEADYVDAILIVGQPGNTGFNAVGKILNGEVNPSGHLADLYATDFTVTPSYANINKKSDYTGMVHYFDKDGNNLTPSGSTYLTQYEEGIYIGYRYYETMATLNGITVGNVEDGQTMTGKDWYDAHVVYPFGYGMSYTQFEYSDIKITGEVSANGKVNATVTVKNIGDYAGKDVIQLYYSAPYTAGGIEKSAVVLGDYAKTKLLQPGQSQKISISINAADMASYDYNLNDGEGGYVLDAGDYEISLRSDSHNLIKAGASAKLSLASKITSGLNLDTDGNDVHNQFSDVTETVNGNPEETVLAFDSALSRATMATKTVTSIYDNVHVSQGTKNVFVPGQKGAAGSMQEVNDIYYVKLSEDEADDWREGTRMRAAEDDALFDKWAESDGNGGYKLNGNGPADPATRAATASVKATDLIGKSYDDANWDKLLDELSIEELHQLFREGGYGTVGIDYIGLPKSFNMDGPYGWTGGSASWEGDVLGTDTYPLFCSEVMVACTFNKELAYEEGKMIGEQGLWGTNNNGSAYTWTGYYSPGMNIHRSPFDARGTEYYSEDPVLTGYSAANLALGAQEKGTFVTLKHFAVYNDGNSPVRAAKGTPDPTGFSVWLDEQTMREVYLKGFEIAVKTGSATGVMTSFARIGYVYCGVNYALCTEVLRNEWGFNGTVVSDIVFYANQDGTLMALAGNNLALTKAPQTWTYYAATDNAVKAGSVEAGQLNAENGGGVINVLWEKINAGEAETETEAFNLYLEENAKAATAIYNALREGAHGVLYTIVNSNAMQTAYSEIVKDTASGSTDNSGIIDAIDGVNDKIDDLNDKIDNGDVLDAIDGLAGKVDGINVSGGTTTDSGVSTIATVGMVFGILAFVASGAAVTLIILNGKKKN